MAAFQEGTVIAATSLSDDQPFSVTVTSSEPVARGGSAIIFVGSTSESAVDHGPLALKVFIHLLTVDEVNRGAQEQLLRRELRAARLVRHPHILPFTGVASKGFHTVLISPYLKNGDLVRYTRENPTVNRNTLVLQVAEAVEHLHTVHRIVHGDLKCENVLVSNEGNAMLADFGLSTVIDKVEGQTKTATGVRLRYTVQFAAPELLAADGPSSDVPSKTCATDVYAFGVTILQAFTGQHPWPGLGFQAIVQAVCSSENEYLYRDLYPGSNFEKIGLHDAWWELCLKCWNRDPMMRPSMTRVLAQLLRAHKPYAPAETYLAATARDSVSSAQRLRMMTALWSSEDGRKWLVANKALLLNRLVKQWRRLQAQGDNDHANHILAELRFLDDALIYGSLEMARATRPLSQLMGTSAMDTYTTFPIAIPHAAWLKAIAFLPSGRHLVGVSLKGSLCVWDVETGEPLDKKEADDDSEAAEIYCAAFWPGSANGSLVACGYSTSTIRVSMLDAGRLGEAVNVMDAGDDAAVQAVAFLPSGSQLASGSRNGVLRIWDIRSGRQIAQALHTSKGSIKALAASGDGSQIVSGSEDGTVRMWQSSGLQALRPKRRHGNGAIRLGSPICSLAFSPNSKLIAAGCEAGRTYVLNVEQPPLARTQPEPPRALLPAPGSDPVAGVAFTASGGHIISIIQPVGPQASIIHIADSVTGHAIAVLKQNEPICGFACSPDGTRLVTGQGHNGVRVRDRAPPTFSIAGYGFGSRTRKTTSPRI